MGMFIVFFVVGKDEKIMPRTKGESIFFTALTAWIMVYAMTLYNTTLAMKSFSNSTLPYFVSKT